MSAGSRNTSLSRKTAPPSALGAGSTSLQLPKWRGTVDKCLVFLATGNNWVSPQLGSYGCWMLFLPHSSLSHVGQAIHFSPCLLLLSWASRHWPSPTAALARFPSSLLHLVNSYVPGPGLRSFYFLFYLFFLHLQRLVFLGGFSSRCWPGPTLLSF